MGPKKKSSGKKSSSDGVALKEMYEILSAEYAELKKENEENRIKIQDLSATNSRLKETMKEALNSCGAELSMKKAVSSDMTRQYKSMKIKLTETNLELETKLKQTQNELEKTSLELEALKASKEKQEKATNEELQRLEKKLESMESIYEQITMEALDNMTRKAEEARNKWEDDAAEVQARNKELLAEFGLSYLAV